ncbi:MAG: hypothetical protein AABO58_06805 [Acidobacteriota bacterium]
MKFAARVFSLAGVYGLGLALLYFLESKLGVWLPPAINHPEFYYGFTGTVVALHLLFFVVAKDPARYRPLMPLFVLEKAIFGGTMICLYLAGRVGLLPWVYGGLGDLGWGVLFLLSYLKLKEGAPVPAYGAAR